MTNGKHDHDRQDIRFGVDAVDHTVIRDAETEPIRAFEGLHIRGQGRGIGGKLFDLADNARPHRGIDPPQVLVRLPRDDDPHVRSLCGEANIAR